MSIRKVVIFTALLSLGTLMPVPLEARGSEPLARTSKNEQNLLPLLNYLSVLGRDYDYFFTIEQGWRDGDSMNEMGSYSIQQSSEKSDLQQELERLRRIVPGLTYEINKVNPRIIHIVDARLARQNGYGLEKTIKSINFKGVVNELPSAIGRQSIAVSPPPVMFSQETRDYTTVVDVRGQGLKVRDALSNFVPLEGRKGRILWMARTKLAEGGVTYIYYPYPDKPTKP